LLSFFSRKKAREFTGKYFLMSSGPKTSFIFLSVSSIGCCWQPKYVSVREEKKKENLDVVKDLLNCCSLLWFSLFGSGQNFVVDEVCRQFGVLVVPRKKKKKEEEKLVSSSIQSHYKTKKKKKRDYFLEELVELLQRELMQVGPLKQEDGEEWDEWEWEVQQLQ
jgi:hypothetical protein